MFSVKVALLRIPNFVFRDMIKELRALVLVQLSVLNMLGEMLHDSSVGTFAFFSPTAENL